VPHLRVEEEIQEFLAAEDEERQLAVVTGVPDEKKGERLVVLHLLIDKTPDEIVTALRSKGLPNLWIPGTDCFLEVPELPLLGSGKLDLKGLAKVAQEHFGK
jgi:acyl-[acyl-carrier-protein]-phospholipid O-acyltransferase/long-chain-fatty-acid--[acyl-carrier-protein] ligase